VRARAFVELAFNGSLLFCSSAELQRDAGRVGYGSGWVEW
jgi:hypothetical protein